MTAVATPNGRKLKVEVCLAVGRSVCVARKAEGKTRARGTYRSGQSLTVRGRDEGVGVFDARMVAGEEISSLNAY